MEKPSQLLPYGVPVAESSKVGTAPSGNARRTCFAVHTLATQRLPSCTSPSLDNKILPAGTASPASRMTPLLCFLFPLAIRRARMVVLIVLIEPLIPTLLRLPLYASGPQLRANGEVTGTRNDIKFGRPVTTHNSFRAPKRIEAPTDNPARPLPPAWMGVAKSGKVERPKPPVQASSRVGMPNDRPGPRSYRDPLHNYAHHAMRNNTCNVWRPVTPALIHGSVSHGLARLSIQPETIRS